VPILCAVPRGPWRADSTNYRAPNPLH